MDTVYAQSIQRVQKDEPGPYVQLANAPPPRASASVDAWAAGATSWARPGTNWCGSDCGCRAEQGAPCMHATPPIGMPLTPPRGTGARAACQRATAARQQAPPLPCMGSGGYLLGTAQALIGADPTAGAALSKALHACMQHRQSVCHSHRQGEWQVGHVSPKPQGTKLGPIHTHLAP